MCTVVWLDTVHAYSTVSVRCSLLRWAWRWQQIHRCWWWWWPSSCQEARWHQLRGCSHHWCITSHSLSSISGVLWPPCRSVPLVVVKGRCLPIHKDRMWLILWMDKTITYTKSSPKMVSVKHLAGNVEEVEETASYDKAVHQFISRDATVWWYPPQDDLLLAEELLEAVL